MVTNAVTQDSPVSDYIWCTVTQIRRAAACSVRCVWCVGGRGLMAGALDGVVLELVADATLQRLMASQWQQTAAVARHCRRFLAQVLEIVHQGPCVWGPSRCTKG